MNFCNCTQRFSLGTHAQEGYCSCPCLSVCVCVCLCGSVKSHLTSGASVHPENIVTYSVGNGGQNICGVFPETAPLQRSSTAPLNTVGDFPAESMHAHYRRYHVKWSFFLC